MSFNQHHIEISRSNYEEYFLLYVDNELNLAERAAVDAFVQFHPDLKEELELLMTTKVDAEMVSFDKTSLFAASMKTGDIDEALLSYVDNELEGEEKENIEKKIAAGTEYRLQYELLLQARLDKNEIIRHPRRDELYRRTERRMLPASWMRVAAAVVLLFGGATAVWVSNTAKEGNPDVAFDLNTQVKTEPVINTQPVSVAPEVKQETGNEVVLAAVKKEKPAREINHSLRKPSVKQIPAPYYKEDQLQALNQQPAEYRFPNKVSEISATNAIAQQTIATQQTINRDAVTTTINQPYHTQNDAQADGSMAQFAAASDDDKKGSVRGFLRKASRFIERRTGINPVNEDDQLLVGALAINLK